MNPAISNLVISLGGMQRTSLLPDRGDRMGGSICCETWRVGVRSHGAWMRGAQAMDDPD
jgi:hypothetical protein